MRFADIPGHEPVKRHLRSLVDADRLPHALLLSGAEGSGKMLLARALAQYIHCTARHDGDSCGRCPSCLQHASHSNADLHFVYPIVKSKAKHLLVSTDNIAEWRGFISNYPYGGWQNWLDALDAGNSRPAIYVDESADILRKMNMSNYAARFKVLIFWLPEKLQPDAANKLLKIIEEPYADTRFIFVSNEPQAILPTIYSRLQRVEVPRFSDADITRILVDEKGVDQELALQIAAMSEGNACAAIEGVDVAGEYKEFMSLFQEIMRNAYGRKVKQLNIQAEAIAAMGREKIIRFLAYCSRMVRENFIYNLRMPGLVRLNRSEEMFSSRFSPFVNTANAPQMMELFDSASADISRNANARIVMFDTLLQLIVQIIKKP